MKKSHVHKYLHPLSWHLKLSSGASCYHGSSLRCFYDLIHCYWCQSKVATCMYIVYDFYTMWWENVARGIAWHQHHHCQITSLPIAFWIGCTSSVAKTFPLSCSAWEGGARDTNEGGFGSVWEDAWNFTLRLMHHIITGFGASVDCHTGAIVAL